MKTFVIGDIHGAHKALQQCLIRSSFDFNLDRLIVLGDVSDGWPQVKESFNELLKIKYLDYIIGNHDLWMLDWALQGIKDDVWINQGGENTLASYNGKPVPLPHIELLNNAHLYLELENKLFVHGGFDPFKPIAQQKKEFLVWDRQLIQSAYLQHFKIPNAHFSSYDEIFLGHTPTLKFHSLEPLKLCNIWALDTGAGWSGKLTIMDIHTKKYWQSDPTSLLYPDTQGRLK